MKMGMRDSLFLIEFETHKLIFQIGIWLWLRTPKWEVWAWVINLGAMKMNTIPFKGRVKWEQKKLNTKV